jgi:hypothetical protein
MRYSVSPCVTTAAEICTSSDWLYLADSPSTKGARSGSRGVGRPCIARCAIAASPVPSSTGYMGEGGVGPRRQKAGAGSAAAVRRANCCWYGTTDHNSCTRTVLSTQPYSYSYDCTSTVYGRGHTVYYLPYTVRACGHSYSYYLSNSPLGWGGYGSGPLRSGLCPWRSIPCPVQARHTESSGQGRKRLRVGGEGVVTRGAADGGCSAP